MNTIPTNADGLTQTDERAIQKAVRKNLRSGFAMTADQKADLLNKHLLEYEKAVQQGVYLSNEVMKTLLVFEQTDIKRLEIFDKIDRLDAGEVTDRTESFTIIINEDRTVPPPAHANGDTQPVPQAD